MDAVLAKKKKVTLSVDTTECKYCGKLYHTGKKLTEHINQEHPGEQTIYACPYCTQPFNQYSEYLQHLGEHKDRIIRCSICNKEFKTITKLRVHTKTYVNQCPFCSENFLTVTVTVYFPSSRIDHFTPLMILHSIQSNSAACSNSMNCNCPLI